MYRTTGRHEGTQGEAAASDAVAEAEVLFDLIDTKKDGHLTRAELIKALRRDESLAARLHLPQHVRQEGDDSRTRFEALFQQLDDDDDKIISRTEWANHFRAESRPTGPSHTGGGAPTNTSQRDDASHPTRDSGYEDPLRSTQDLEDSLGGADRRTQPHGATRQRQHRQHGL